MLNKTIILLLFLFFGNILSAQLHTDFVFDHLIPEKYGLKKMYFPNWDSKGRLWLLTNKGPGYYDGYQIKIFPHIDKDSNSVLENDILSMYMDAEDNLWVAYINIAGITKYSIKENKYTHHIHDTLNPKSFPNAPVVYFKQDTKKNIWVMTWGEGLIKINSSTLQIEKHYKYNPNEGPAKENEIRCNQIKFIFELKDGRFLIGFFAGNGTSTLPMYFNPDDEVFTLFPIADFKADSEMEYKRIHENLKICHFVYVDINNNIWFGTYSGLCFFDTKNKTCKRVSGKPFVISQINTENTRTFITDENNYLWVSTVNSGVMLVDINTQKAKYVKHNPKLLNSISSNSIGIMNKDKDGNIWLTTSSGGFSIYNPLRQQFYLHEWDNMDLDFSNRSAQLLPVNQMLVKSSEEIYLSSETGLIVYNPKNYTSYKTLDPYNKFSYLKFDFKSARQNVHDFKILDNELYFTSNQKPFLYTNNKISKIPSNEKNSYHLAFKHSNSNTIFIYSAYDRVTYTYNKEKNKLDTFIVFSKDIWLDGVWSISLASGKWLWKYGNKKLILINPDDKTYKIFGADSKDNFFPDSTITCIYSDTKGVAWIGTSKGLYSFNDITGDYKLWNDELEIEDEQVNAIITDKYGIKWIALNKEIIRWDDKNNRTFRFGREFGVLSTFIPSVAQMDESGRIYIASIDGIFTFNPQLINIPDTKPVLNISQLILNDDTLTESEINEFLAGKKIFNWNENNFLIDFYTSQIYTPSAHRFYYKFSSDSVWQDNGISNRLKLNNLYHGNYFLTVKIINSYGVESELLHIKFIINKPVWLRWWFYVICGITLFFILWVYIKQREKKYLKQQQILENRVAERTAEVVQKAQEIQQQKEIIEEKNKELTDSINYAKKIQQSILPDKESIRKKLKDHFVMFLPKDIVSGDFYWYSAQKDSVLWAVVDCTGHGVPGGFMSMLGAGLLNQIVNEELKLQPNIILNELRNRVIMALRQTGADGENRDGMDISLCRYTFKTNILQFSGANNSLYITRNNELIELKPDKQPIGIHIGELKPFTLNEFKIQKGDIIYMSSDGYADQFGGEKGKKFKSSNFEKLILEISKHTIQEQHKLFESTFVNWKGNFEQLDDVCVIGVKL